VEAVSVQVDLTHSFIGDLVLTLQPPEASGVGNVVLHNRSGGTRNSIKKVYDKSTTPKLGNFKGKAGNGRWTLKVQDAEAQDTGTLVSFSVRLVFAAVAPVAPVKSVVAKKGAVKTAPAKKAAAAKKRATTVKRAGR
jgi:subtilisin-like proprotein convertase family protein